MKVIKITGEIGWDTTARDVKWEISRASGDITVEVDSAGGSVFQGIEIYNALKDYKGGKVKVIIGSLAASIASYIALAGDTIESHDNSVYMIHNARMFVGGDHNELRKKADIIDGLSNIIAKKYIEITGKSEKEVKKMMDDETFFYGSEMVDAGFVNAIIDTEEDKDSKSAKALAHEKYVACMNDANSRYEDADFTEAAALLQVLEEPKPTAQMDDKESASKEIVANAIIVNAINARLNVKEKQHG